MGQSVTTQGETPVLTAKSTHLVTRQNATVFLERGGK